MIYLILRGRIGNQLFQYAAARAFQIKRGNKEKIIIDDSEVGGADGDVLIRYHFSNVEFTHEKLFQKMNELSWERHCMSFYDWFLFKHKNMRRFELEKKYSHLFSFFGYVVCWNGFIDFDVCKSKNVLMEGYFQSANYFDEYRSTVLQEIKIQNIICKDRIDEMKELIDQIHNSDSTCIHVRRGDYVGSDYEVCTKDYYYNAIELVKSKYSDTVFFVFSDDIDWCKRNFIEENRFIFVEGNTDYEDLFLMSQCKNFVISNSSFGWWAQYLEASDNSFVVAPSKWMKTEIQQDMYMPEWKLI